MDINESQTFEHILVKNLLDSTPFFSRAFPSLEERYFSGMGTQKLFVLMKNYYDKYRTVPSIQEVVNTVKGIQNRQLKEIIISDLKKVQESSVVLNVDYMIDETNKHVKTNLYKQAIMVGAEAVQKNDEEGMTKSWSIMEESRAFNIETNLGLDYQDIDSRIDYYKQKTFGILSSLKSLNKRLGTGFAPKTLSVIAAASGVGKSLLMTDVITSFILQGKNVLLVSMEMSEFEIVKRVDANCLDIPISDFRDLDKDVIRDKFNDVKDVLGAFFTNEFPPGTFSAGNLESLLDMYEIEKGIKFDAIVLDYIGIMKCDALPASVGTYSYVKKISEEVRAVAVKRSVPIISASQLNRCLSGDTMVETSSGNIKKIKNLNVNEYIKGSDGDVLVKGKTKTKKQKTYKITLKSGKSIVCSGNHKFPTKHGSMTINHGLDVGIELKS